ncbi:hypothetical protein Tco_0682791 [Tanacetum coccineum]|uniref:Uncharacterized protein n=1 Tax=Tanacetum coccineum TaxID=301880 RepID=A0ABQ4XT33_9ASTR
MAMSLMHQWHDTICGSVIGPRRSLFGAYGCILGVKREAGKIIRLVLQGAYGCILGSHVGSAVRLLCLELCGQSFPEAQFYHQLYCALIIVLLEFRIVIREELGFTAALAVLITGASQSRQHDTLVRLPIDIRLKIDLENQLVCQDANVIDRLDHDAGPFFFQVTPSSLWQVIHTQAGSNIMKNSSNKCECAITELIEFIRAHQPVSLVLILIDDSLRVFVCSVWCHFGDVISESLRLGDIKFLLVAFDSQLKVFHPHKNNNTSGEHPQSYI